MERLRTEEKRGAEPKKIKKSGVGKHHGEEVAAAGSNEVVMWGGGRRFPSRFDMKHQTSMMKPFRGLTASTSGVPGLRNKEYVEKRPKPGKDGKKGSFRHARLANENGLIERLLN